MRTRWLYALLALFISVSFYAIFLRSEITTLERKHAASNVREALIVLNAIENEQLELVKELQQAELLGGLWQIKDYGTASGDRSMSDSLVSSSPNIIRKAVKETDINNHSFSSPDEAIKTFEIHFGKRVRR